MTHALPQLTPLADVARLLRIPPRRIADRARARQFAHIRIGKERYVTAEQLADLLKTYEVAPVAVKSDREKALDETRERLARSGTRRRPAA
ncbi:hypothetical protein ACN267_31180 [Micromonospora sp. WMMD734]|uniref:hypothetical protein n=1 Tax=Micromonospora sp. WMMD734 TaxID=3404129 RepID=UPI003B953FB2